MKQAEKVPKVGSKSYSYSNTKKLKVFWTKKYANRAHAFKDIASSYNVEILNCFDPELQHKNIESAI